MALLIGAAAGPPRPPPPPHLRLRSRCRSHTGGCVLRRRGISARWFLRGLPPESGGPSLPGAPAEKEEEGWSLSLLRVAAPSILFLVGLGAFGAPLARSCSAVAGDVPVRSPVATTESELTDSSESGDEGEKDDEEWRREFERWKSKTYALTVPLRIVALRGSLPPSWIKDFIQVHGKRLKLIPEFRGSLDAIFSDLSLTSRTGRLEPKSAMAADIVSVGDSWLTYAIAERLIEPIQGAEEHAWFQNLSSKWKVYLCRNDKGEIDDCGKIWAVPYRWGCMVIAYKKKKFRKHNLAPIKDWDDLWRGELRGKVVMVDSPREVVGAVLKSMGASYNTKGIDLQVPGGMNAVTQRLAALQRQVRLFDSANYLKAFATADAWVAVGWSSDILPIARRQSDVSVIVPESGSSLWADLWAIPAAGRFPTEKVGGRGRGPSPMVNQWMEFCLQAARAIPYQQGVVPGASPLTLEGPLCMPPQGVGKGQPELETNLVGGAPPPETLSNCEFLEPLSEEASAEHRRLVGGMAAASRQGWIGGAQDSLSSFLARLARTVHS